MQYVKSVRPGRQTMLNIGPIEGKSCTSNLIKPVSPSPHRLYPPKQASARSALQPHMDDQY